MHSKIKKIKSDIESITIQGATNVALATLEGIGIYLENTEEKGDELIKGVREIGSLLSRARDNEPLARNAVKYISHYLKSSDGDLKSIIETAVSNYKQVIKDSKELIMNFGTEALEKEDVVLTHCHSSTATKTLINVDKMKKIKGEDFEVVSTETRPLYQGRKTAKELTEAGVQVTQVVDSACVSLITEDQYKKVGAVIVGCDELLLDGSFINKVGTLSMALAAQKGADEFYVATTLLKLGKENLPEEAVIEQRDAREVWPDAPKGLLIINPAFERVSSEYVTGYITEAGVLDASELVSSAKELYPWLFTD